MRIPFWPIENPFGRAGRFASCKFPSGMPNSLSETTLAVTQPPSGVMTPVNPSECPDAQFGDLEKGLSDKTEIDLPKQDDHGWRRIVRGFTPSISVHEVTPEKLTAACLLPAVSCLVAASTGGQVAQMEALQAHEALWTLLTCYCCWAIGFFVGLMILCIYFYRLLLFKLPSQEVVVSVFLSLGPLGQGSFGILQCGKAAKMIFPKLTLLPSEAGTILYIMGLIMGLVIWAMAIPWMCFAVGSVLRLKFRFPFNIGWWAFLYPVGGVASATITLSAELDSAFFGVIAEVLTAIIVLVWIICFVRTIRGAFTGELFPKPGVCELRPDSGAKVRLHRPMLQNKNKNKC
ncbi:sulfite efflux pump SSU1, partial [Aureobasidium melanogenum]